jgi:mono/diheme cytochrome c family protein
LVLVVAWGLGGALAHAQSAPSDFRQHELTRLLLQDCTQCHGMRLTGESAPPLTGAALADKNDGHLVEVIMQGRHRSPMPAWASKLSESEAQWIVQRLREGPLDVR